MTVLAWLNSLPGWCTTGIVGAMLGGAGGAAGGFLSKLRVPFAEYAFIPFAVASIPLSQNIIQPKLLEMEVNKNLPHRGTHSTLVRVEITRDTAVYFVDVDDTVPEGTNVADQVRTRNLAEICEPSRDDFESGRIKRVEFRYTLHGSVQRLIVDPESCKLKTDG